MSGTRFCHPCRPFSLTKDVCDEGNAVPNVHDPVAIPLWFTLVQTACLHDQSDVHVILVGPPSGVHRIID